MNELNEKCLMRCYEPRLCFGPFISCSKGPTGDVYQSSLAYMLTCHLTVDGSSFRKTVGEFIMLPGDLPEPNLDFLVYVNMTICCEA